MPTGQLRNDAGFLAPALPHKHGTQDDRLRGSHRSATRRLADRRAEIPVPASSQVPPNLNCSQFMFCLAYVANGFNATAAYRAAYPDASPRSARELGHRLLTKVDIRAFLVIHVTQRWEALQMSGDEVLVRLALVARADPRLLFDDTGQLLSPHQWPDEIALAVEAFRISNRKTIFVQLANKLGAFRLILEEAGRIPARGRRR